MADLGALRAEIAESRIQVDTARLLVLRAASKMDEAGPKAARTLISEAKVYVPNAALSVIDKAMQVHGGVGVSHQFPLAACRFFLICFMFSVAFTNSIFSLQGTREREQCATWMDPTPPIARSLPRQK